MVDILILLFFICLGIGMYLLQKRSTEKLGSIFTLSSMVIILIVIIIWVASCVNSCSDTSDPYTEKEKWLDFWEWKMEKEEENN